LAKEHPGEVELRRKKDATATASRSLASIFAFPAALLRESKRVMVDDLRDVPSDIIARRANDAMWKGGASITANALGDPSGERREGLFEMGGSESRSEKDHESEGERITHLAFHRAASVIALATSFSRVHFFDMKTNTFLPHYLCTCNTTDPKSPEFAQITGLAFGGGGTNSLAVGLDSGYFDLWYIDLSNAVATPSSYSGGIYSLFSTPYNFQESPTQFRQPGMFRPHETFKAKASPETQRLLGSPDKVHAKSQRIGLLRQGFGRMRGLVGGVTALSFSPRGEYVLVGTSLGGVWVYSVTWGTTERLYQAAGTSVSCASWEMEPGGEVDAGGKTVIVVGMKSGLVVYLHFAASDSYSEITSQPIEFYPAQLMTTLHRKQRPRGIKNLILVPSYKPVPHHGLPKDPCLQYPTLIISFSGAPGIYIFRLKRNSVLRAVSPPSTPTKAKNSSMPKRLQPQQQQQQPPLIPTVLGNIKSFGNTFLREPLGLDPYIPVYSTCINTDHVVFTNATASPQLKGSAYGGVVENMALDPTGKRLIVTFSRGEVEESVVWFDTGALMTPAGGVKAVGVLRHRRRRRRGEDGEGRMIYGDVGFAGSFRGGACAGLVEGSGSGVSLFPAWVREGGG